MPTDNRTPDEALQPDQTWPASSTGDRDQPRRHGTNGARPADQPEQNPADATPEVCEVVFANGRRAPLITVSASTPVRDVLARLNIEPPSATIIILGGQPPLGESVTARLATLFGRGVAPAAINSRAVVIDSAAKSGVGGFLGQLAAVHVEQSVFIGVAPRACVPMANGLIHDPSELDPNHTHFVVTPGERWGDESDMVDLLARELVPTGKTAVAILAGGDTRTRVAALRCLQRGWGLIVIEGSGGTADEIVNLRKKPNTPAADPIVAEIATRGDVYILPDEARADRLERLILQRLGQDDSLVLAWRAFAEFDRNAVTERRWFGGLQLTLLLLAVTAVVFGLWKAVFSGSQLPQLSKEVVVVIPILTTLVFAMSNRFKHGPRWVLLRGGAEAIKSEIFQYRARAREYAGPDSEKRLAREVTGIREHLARTEVKELALRTHEPEDVPPKGILHKEDDGISLLSAQRYVEFRLRDQINFYRSKAAQLDAKLRFLLVMSFVLGGLATYLAAVGLEPWIAVTTAVVTAITAYLGYEQVEFTLSRYTQSAMTLANIEVWWTALSPGERRDLRNIYKLIKSTEGVLDSEMTGWVQQMRDALAHLHDDADGQREQQSGTQATRNGNGTDDEEDEAPPPNKTRARARD
jgi:hypothetical protein